jgi:ribosomal protein L11 methyltransferase
MSTDRPFLWRIEVRVPAAARDAVADFLESVSAAVSMFEDPIDSGRWRVESFTGAEPDRVHIAGRISRACQAAGTAPLADPRFELVAARDWVAENQASFPPVRVGRCFIYGSHVAAAPPPASIPIRLDPGTAFGSGEHASTAGCLELLQLLAKRHRFERPLDLGCGSGILSIAMAKLFHVPVLASDLDDEAARVTALNARKNGVGRLVRALTAPGYRAPAIAAEAPFDLIVANILANPLIRMAGDLARHLRPPADGGGIAVLSGLVERDGRRVLAAHQAHGLRLRYWRVRDGWLTLGLER